MPNSSDILFKETDFTATGDGPSLKTQVCIVAVTGSFTGEVRLRWIDEGGTHHTVHEDGAELTMSGEDERVLNFGVPVILYWQCTSYTSGSIKASITGTTAKRS